MGLLAECGALMGLSTIAVSLRFYGSTNQRLSLGPDDWTALFGVVTFLVQCSIAIELAVLKSYSDYDSGSLTPEQVTARAKPEAQMAIAYDFLCMTTLACAKLSALFLYHRIFSMSSSFNIIIKGSVAVIAAWYITFNVLSCLQCRSHFSAFWNGTCTEYCDLNLVWAQDLAISNFTLDLWVLLLPIPSILRLYATLARKLSVIGIFLLAFVGLGASVTRIVVFYLDTSPGERHCSSACSKPARPSPT